MGVRLTILEEGRLRRQLQRLERNQFLTKSEERTRESVIALLSARLRANSKAQRRDAEKGRHARVR